MIIIRIDLEKSRVIFTPESDKEKIKMEALWKVLIDCVKDSRKLVPIGEYVPQKGITGASFNIEGLESNDSSFVEVKVDKETSIYCRTCNKLLTLKAGDVIPLCCGKYMDIID